MSPASEVVALDSVALARNGALVLDVPSFRVAAGELVAVQGANGAGKSTLLRTVALLERPDRGSVRLFGEAVAGRDELALRRRLTLVLQEPFLLDDSVLGNAMLGLRWRGVPADEAAKRARLWLERLGVGGLAGRPARAVSGGEARRVALARSFATDPELVLLDEPFAALDQPTREALLVELRAILSEGGQTALVVTHDRGEVLRLADRVVVLGAGRILQDGAVAEVFARPADDAVASFTGRVAVLQGRVTGVDEELVEVATGSWTVRVVGRALVGAAACLAIEPGDVVLGAPDAVMPPTSFRNRFACRVRSVASGEGAVLLELASAEEGGPGAAPELLRSLVTRRTVRELALAPGVRVAAFVKATAVRLFPR